MATIICTGCSRPWVDTKYRVCPNCGLGKDETPSTSVSTTVGPRLRRIRPEDLGPEHLGRTVVITGTGFTDTGTLEFFRKNMVGVDLHFRGGPVMTFAKGSPHGMALHLVDPEGRR